MHIRQPAGGDSDGSAAEVETALLLPAESLKIAPGVPVTVEWVSSAVDDADTTVEILADADGNPETTADQLRLAAAQAATTIPTVIDWRTDAAPAGH